MSSILPGSPRALVFAPLLVLALIWVWVWRTGPPVPRRDLTRWDLPRLLEHLRARGVDLYATSPMKDGPIVDKVYLTTEPRDWPELQQLFRDNDQIDRWRGVLFCERLNVQDDRTWDLQRWGDCCLVVGPFVFFGDRDLLARVRAALADSCEPWVASQGKLVAAQTGHPFTASSAATGPAAISPAASASCGKTRHPLS
jgi:hypothetical protein